MFEVIVRRSFSAAHALRHYHGATEPLHGHNYAVEVVLRGKSLQNKVKYLVDFTAVHQALEAILKPLNYVNLNETPPFDRENPSAENVALFIGQQLAKRWKARGVSIGSVTVWETEAQAARYLP